MPKETPVRRQYLQIKAQYPDTIVFFRLGDFYETFDEDAEIAARELDIVLTSRPVSKSQRVPMAGVPHHAVQAYIARLIDKGYRVAIAEQVGEVTGRGLVDREVTRIVTPGTIVEPELLDDKKANYLAAFVTEGDQAGLAYVDITTGEFATTQLGEDSLLQELARLQPRECIVPQNEDVEAASDRLKRYILTAEIHVTKLPAYRFELSTARRALLDHFDVATLDGFGCSGQPLALRAAGAIIHYLGETQRSARGQIVGLATYSVSGFMTLDAATRRNLELTESIRERRVQNSLLGVLDLTLTPMGGRLLRSRLTQPLLNRGKLQHRLDEVQAFFDHTILRGKTRQSLNHLPDLERLTNRVLSGIAGPRNLVGIRATLEAIPDLIAALRMVAEDGTLSDRASAPPSNASLNDLVDRLDPGLDTAGLIAAAIVDDPPAKLSDGGVIRPGFSTELDGVTAAVRDAKVWIAELEQRERKRTGVKNLKVGYNKIFGYYIEVTKSNIEAVPDDFIRKQTLVNAERYITPELKEAEALILNAEDQRFGIERRLFDDVCQQVGARAQVLLGTARALARVDVAAALAEVAVQNRYVRPEFTDEDLLEVLGGRHPVVEGTLGNTPFTPNDLYLDHQRRILVITGPNMAGKSVYLRQNALIVLMAQMGSFVSADRVRMSIVDRIFTRIGAQDEVALGRSTFMVEMVETANILNHATPHSLLILDEIGRGTSTYDGLSIAWAVVEYLHNHPQRQAHTLFATHYHELMELAEQLPAVANCSLDVVEEGDRVVFLHKVVPGGADRSYGIHVAQLAGIPRPVIHRAEELLTQLESGEFRPGTGPAQHYQPVLFAPEHPVIDELASLDVPDMTPLEAINKLYELQKQARGSESAV